MKMLSRVYVFDFFKVYEEKVLKGLLTWQIDPNRAIEVGDDHPRRIARTCQNHPGVKGSSSKRKNQIRF
jgi:hypothetical protein